MITREEFSELFNKHNLEILFYNVANGGKYTELKNFFIYLDYDSEQVTVLERGSLIGVSWYKYLHPGRSLEVSGIHTKKELDDFLKKLSDDCKLLSEV